VSHALARAGSTGVASVLLWPFLAIPRLLLARTAGEFLRYGGIGLGILLLHYLWVLNADTSFEEASLEHSQKVAARRAARLDTARRGGRLVKRARGFPWKLAPGGRPELALTWKNLINLSRVTPLRGLFALAAFVFAMMTWAIQLSHQPGGLWVGAAFLCVVIATFTSVAGAIFLRNDLREDLFRIDAIKSIPLPGHAVVWGEILGPSIALAAIEVLLLGVASFTLWMSRAPFVEGIPVAWLFAGAAAACLVLPPLTLVAVTVQNALVVMFPAWVSLGNSRVRGLEASGQRILTLFGTLAALTLSALPAAVSGGIAATLLAPSLGPACLFPGAVIAAGWMVAEVAFACRLLGTLFDRIDPSTAGIEVQEA
jgi:hypothetical protein